MDALEFMDDRDIERQFFSVPEAAAVLPMSTSNIYQRIKDRKIPSVMFGKRIFLRRSVLETLKTDGTAPYDRPAVSKETD